MSNLVVAHCVPVYDCVEFDTFVSTVFLAYDWEHVAPKGWSIKPCYGRGQPVSVMRSKLVEMALAGVRKLEGDTPPDHREDVPADIIVFEDSDVSLARSYDVVALVENLLELPFDVGLLGVPCIQQEKTGKLVINVNMNAHGGPENSKAHEPFECSAIGFGLVAIRAAVFSLLPKPWFTFEQRADGVVVGEDLGFCDAIRQVGYKVYADPRIVVSHNFRRAFSVSDPRMGEAAKLSGGA